MRTSTALLLSAVVVLATGCSTERPLHELNGSVDFAMVRNGDRLSQAAVVLNIEEKDCPRVDAWAEINGVLLQGYGSRGYNTQVGSYYAVPTSMNTTCEQVAAYSYSDQMTGTKRVDLSSGAMLLTLDDDISQIRVRSNAAATLSVQALPEGSRAAGSRLAFRTSSGVTVKELTFRRGDVLMVAGQDYAAPVVQGDEMITTVPAANPGTYSWHLMVELEAAPVDECLGMLRCNPVRAIAEREGTFTVY
jgi:hypothetical protein